jgi:hypothetical protein
MSSTSFQQLEYKSSLRNQDGDDFVPWKQYQSTYMTQLGKLNDQMYRIARVPGTQVFPVRDTLYTWKTSNSDKKESDYSSLDKN